MELLSDSCFLCKKKFICYEDEKTQTQKIFQEMGICYACLNKKSGIGQIFLANSVDMTMDSYNFEEKTYKRQKVMGVDDYILELFEGHPETEFTKEYLIKETNTNAKVVKKILSELINKKKIEAIGKSKNKKYRLKNR